MTRLFPLLAACLLSCVAPAGPSAEAERSENAEWRKFLTTAQESLSAKQDRLRSDHGLTEFERWDWGQETGEIVFSTGGVPGLRAGIIFVGSTSTRSDTWRWAWANSTVDAGLSAPLERVREFGRKRGFTWLDEAQWPAGEVDGWEMTSVAAQVLEADGAYRTPDDDGATFLLLMNVRDIDAQGPDR